MVNERTFGPDSRVCDVNSGTSNLFLYDFYPIRVREPVNGNARYIWVIAGFDVDYSCCLCCSLLPCNTPCCPDLPVVVMGGPGSSGKNTFTSVDPIDMLSYRRLAELSS